MPKTVQTAIQFCSFHMLAKFCSKSFKPDFNSKWTENFQMYKLGFKEAEEPEIKLPICDGSWRKQGNSRKKISFIDYAKAFGCVDHNKLWKFLKRWEFQTILPTSWETCMQVRTGHGTTDWFKIGKGLCQSCTLSLSLFNSMQSTSCEIPGWMNHKMESRLPRERTIVSDMQMIPI